MNKAFTLIELLIVIIIIAILATLAIPAYQGIIWRGRYSEVYRIVGTIAKAELIYYQEHGFYAQNDVVDCYVGNGFAQGSTKIQKDLCLDVPSGCFFTYLVYPSTTYPTATNIYFRQPGYTWSWVYNYVNKTWSEYGGAGYPGTGPGHSYFVPPG